MLWQRFLVVAVLIEVAGLAVNPMLAQPAKGGEQINMVTVLRKLLVPTPVRELCTIPDEVDTSSSPLESISHMMGQLVFKVFKFPGLKTKVASACPRVVVVAVAWYCNPLYAQLQGLYIALISFLMDRSMAIVGVMLFFDVFVNFFTGEINPKTGHLVPKDFFTRWFIPGLFLELAGKFR
jgi:hypothetical protein